MVDQYVPDAARYDGRMPYRRCGRSGLLLPAVSLGFWHNFGDDKPLETQRAIMRTAFDLGITHFDLANNYGPVPGSAEETFGRILREDLESERETLREDRIRLEMHKNELRTRQKTLEQMRFEYVSSH